MNTNYNNKSSTNTHPKSSFNSFDFDLGLGSNKPRSLNDQKAPLSSQPKPSPSWLPNNNNNNNKPSPSWTHQPSLSGGPTSLVGDISGKSWGASGSTSKIGIVNKDPSLFGDLVGSVLGQSKGSSNSGGNVPLKNATPVSSKSAYSMGGLGDSLPQGGSVGKAGGGWGSSESFGSFASAQSNKSFGSVSKGSGLGGPSMKNNMAGGGMSSGKDPFGNLVNFGSKQSGTKVAGSGGVGNAGSDVFGVFQNASKSGTSAFKSGAGDGSVNKSVGSAMDDFGEFASGGTGVNNAGFMGSNESYNSSSTIDDFGGFASTGAGFSSSSFIGSNTSSKSAINDFGMPPANSVPQNQSSGVDPLDALFSSPSAAAGSGGQQSTGFDDWGLDSEFGGDGGHDVGGTTELEGLPPPPAGVSGSTAMNKGMDNHKQGQYPDAIKWFSWAIVLFEKAGDAAATRDVLSSRASCYKEVGEYKKAVADCTKVLEKDDKNVSILVQRALLYESMEKYKLGAEDLRTVLKIDPLNRIARSTIHRLTKMAD